MSEADTIRDTTIIPAGQIDCYGMSSPGRVHSLNADSLLVADLTPYLNRAARSNGASSGDQSNLRPGQLLIVADGVGREWLGQRASNLAVEYLRDAILTPAFRHPVGQRDDDELVD